MELKELGKIPGFEFVKSLPRMIDCYRLNSSFFTLQISRNISPRYILPVTQENLTKINISAMRIKVNSRDYLLIREKGEGVESFWHLCFTFVITHLDLFGATHPNDNPDVTWHKWLFGLTSEEAAIQQYCKPYPTVLTSKDVLPRMKLCYAKNKHLLTETSQQTPSH